MSLFPNRFGNRSKRGGLLVAAVATLYCLVAPYANQRYGWNLPTWTSSSAGLEQVIPPEHAGDPAASAATTPSRTADRQVPATQAGESPETTAGDQRLFGILQPLGRDRYRSPAGLLYTPGSAEGHRLKHLQRHVVDDPDRPGPHGVFDGGMEGALQTIDRAFARAEQGRGATRQEDQGRTIYTVDLGGRVGFVGGREGRRKRHPSARRVRLVLEGNRVITAYPL